MKTLFLGFLVMSFADGIGVAVSRLGSEYAFSPLVMGLLPSLMFVWFFALSVPIGGLCERFGRKRVAMISLLLAAVFLMLPVVSRFAPVAVYVAAFAMLGIANVGLQVSMPPMVSVLAAPGLPAGRVMMCLSGKTGMAAAIPFVFSAFALIGKWEWAFPSGGLLAIAVVFFLNRLEMSQARVENQDASGRGMLRMLLEPSVFLLVGVFAFAVCHEVWMNLAMPGFLRDRYGWGDSRMGLGAGIYFFAKIPVMLVGSVLLSKFPPSRFLLPCVLSVAVGTMVLLLAPTVIAFLCGVLLVSVGSANFFGIIFGLLTELHPGKLDALSALLVMSISLGAVVSPVMTFCGWRF